MKKVISLICLISALFIATPAHAAYDVDKMLESGLSLIDIVCMIEANATVMNELSQLNTNEIAVMEMLLEREIQRRSDFSKEVVVPMGEYIVGEDIPAGIYTVVTGDGYCNLEVYSNGKKIYDYDSLESKTIGKLTLKDGQTVHIKYDSVTFSPYKGLGF